jgi:hypothetical protein
MFYDKKIIYTNSHKLLVFNYFMLKKRVKSDKILRDLPHFPIAYCLLYSRATIGIGH